jgi:hypothetical protein
VCEIQTQIDSLFLPSVRAEEHLLIYKQASHCLDWIACCAEMEAMLKSVTPSLSLGTSIRSSSSCPGEKAAFGAYNGLRRASFNSSKLTNELLSVRRVAVGARRSDDLLVRAATGNGAAQQFDYNVVIIGTGVGGHGAALHAVEKVRSLPAPCCPPRFWLLLFEWRRISLIDTWMDSMPG